MKNLICKAALLPLCVLAGAAPNLHAATRAKADNADSLNLATSWTNSLAPGTADVARFDSIITAPLTVSLGADLTWNQLSFVDPGGDFTIAAGNVLTLSNNVPISFGTGTANLTLNCGVNCAGAAFTILPSAPSGRMITYGGPVQGRNTTVSLGSNAGTLRLGSPNSTQIGTIVQVNSAGIRLGIGASSIGNPIASGPLGTNLFIWGVASVTAELFAYNGAQTLGNPVRISSGPLAFNSSDDLTLSGVIDLNNGNRTILVTNSGVLRFTGTISNATGLTKTGPGVLELGGTNVGVFGNGLSIFGGTVRLLANNVIPDGASAGTLRMTNVTEVLDMNGFSDTIDGLAGSGGAGNWAGTLDNTAAGTTSVLTVGDQFTYVLAGNLQNSGSGSRLALVNVGSGGLILTNAKTFSGGLTNAAASTVYINSAGAAGTGPLVISSPDPAAEFGYNGGGALTWTNDIILNAGTRPTISAADGNTLTIAGVISGAGGLWRPNTLFKQGTLIYSGDNTYTGGFLLYGGAVTLSHPRAAGRGLFTIGDPAFSGGSIYLVPGVNLTGASSITNAVLVNRDFTVGGTNAIEFAGPLVLITNATQRSINVTNLGGAVISGPVSGYGFNKTGPGLLTFNGVCTHDGPSTISTGPLALGPAASFTGSTTFLVGGSGQLDVSAVGGFAISAAQTLTGSGKVSGNVTVQGHLTPSGQIASFTFSNNLALASGSITTILISRGFTNNARVVCYGALTYGGSLVVNNVGAALQAGDTFPLFSFTGSPGLFAGLTLPDLDAGLAWQTNRLSVDGTVSVISTGAGQPQLSNPQLLTPASFVMTATGGTTNGQFRVLTHTNVVEPVTNWVAISTNTYDGSGNLTVTNAVNPAEPQRFFRIVEP